MGWMSWTALCSPMHVNMYVRVRLHCQHADLMLGAQARHNIAARLMPLMDLEVASLLDYTGRVQFMYGCFSYSSTHEDRA